jgi:hypothetical protein
MQRKSTRGQRAGLLLTFLLASFAVARLEAGQQPGFSFSAPAGRLGKKEATAAENALSDAEVLKSAGLNGEDGGRLVEYLKQRTLNDVDQGKITDILKRFGADDFEDRLKASEEIELYGPAAVGPLKAAERDSDPEIAFRAKIVLKKMARIPHTAVAAAVVRAIVKVKPPGAVPALIGFLPLADDETIADLIREALLEMAVKDGQADPALLSALSDPSPVRRSAAYLALINGGTLGAGIRVKTAYPQVREAVLKDGDPEAKFMGLWALLMATRENQYLPELIRIIPTIGRGRLWQLEDLLLQLAGTHPKDGRFFKSAESLARSRDAWLDWWNEKGEKVNFQKFDFKPRILGITDVIEMDNRGFAQGRIVSLGPDMKEKWRITGINNPTDVLIHSNDHIYVVDSNMNQITDRTSTGTINSRHVVTLQPVNIQQAANNNIIVTCRNRVVEYDPNKEWAEVNSYMRTTYDIMAGMRLPKGDVIVLTNAIQGPNCIRLDSKLKETGKSYTLGRIQGMQILDAIDNDTILVCEADRVAEYDLKTGKNTWKYDCNTPLSCQRLINGNTLIALLNTNQALEVDPSGVVVWDYQAKDGLRVGRARRR